MSVFEQAQGGSYALVTGAADRIGKAIALELARMGYHLILHYRRSRDGIEAVQAEIENMGRKTLLVTFDFMDSNDFYQLMAAWKSQAIKLEVLVNSASDFSPSGFEDRGSSMLHKQWKTNFESAYLLIKSFAGLFKEGLVINLLDTKITKNHSDHLDYLLTKKLLAEFTKLAAVELAPEIRVNGICPGLILPPKDKDQRYLLDLATHIPLQRIGSLEDIQRAVRFLIEASFVTGQLLFIDGGEHLS